MIKGDHQLAKVLDSLDWGALFSSEACADVTSKAALYETSHIIMASLSLTTPLTTLQH